MTCKMGAGRSPSIRFQVFGSEWSAPSGRLQAIDRGTKPSPLGKGEALSSILSGSTLKTCLAPLSNTFARSQRPHWQCRRGEPQSRLSGRAPRTDDVGQPTDAHLLLLRE